MALLRLVYEPLITRQINEFINWWNEHPIRKQYGVHDSPSGVPDSLFHHPESHARSDGSPSSSFAQSVCDEDLLACDSFVNEYESNRTVPPPRHDNQGKRITRADLSLPQVPEMSKVLVDLATPTMGSAKSIYRVALYMLTQQRA
jgi:hypothetical protein